jgi:hypothetical protein
VQTDLDCIQAFQATVRSHAGEWWAPESALPCPKAVLLPALVAARDEAYPADMEGYRELRALIGELTMFIPDEELAVIRPFLTAGGRITGRQPPDPESRAAHEKAYELLAAHLAERERLFPHLGSTDSGRRSRVGEQREALHMSGHSGGCYVLALLLIGVAAMIGRPWSVIAAVGASTTSLLQQSRAGGTVVRKVNGP